MDLPLEIAFKDTESSEFLEGLIRERAARLGTLHDHIVSCRAVVHVPHRSAEGVKPPLGLSVEVAVPGSRLIVAKDEQNRHEAKGDIGAVVTRVFERIERQLDEHRSVRHGAVKTHAADGETGRVVRLFPEQNYGFVEVAGSPDLYFTRNAVLTGSFDDLVVGSMVRVTIATSEGPMGPQASSVRPLGDFAALK